MNINNRDQIRRLSIEDQKKLQNLAAEKISQIYSGLILIIDEVNSFDSATTFLFEISSYSSFISFNTPKDFILVLIPLF